MIFINILAIVATIGYLLIGAVTVTAIHQFHLASLRKSNFILLVLAGIFWPLVVLVLLIVYLYWMLTDIG